MHKITRRSIAFVVLSLALRLAAFGATYVYDGSGRLIQVNYGTAGVVTYSYDSAGNLTTRQVTTSQPTDVSSQVKVTGSGLVFSRLTSTYSGTVTIVNIGSTPIAAPIQSVLANLISGATLTNQTGKVPSGPYAGSPYITVAGNSPLAPGASVSISVKFTYTGTAPISYVSKTFSGGF
jgi:YD repeat-containing protein